MEVVLFYDHDVDRFWIFRTLSLWYCPIKFNDFADFCLPGISWIYVILKSYFCQNFKLKISLRISKIESHFVFSTSFPVQFLSCQKIVSKFVSQTQLEKFSALFIDIQQLVYLHTCILFFKRYSLEKSLVQNFFLFMHN